MTLYKLTILTPDGKVYENDVASLRAPGVHGFFGVLANHAPMIVETVPGVLTLKDDRDRFFAVGSGMIEVNNNDACFLCDSAEETANFDEARSKSSRIPAHLR